MATENWAVEDAHGTCSSEGMTEEQARKRARELTEKSGDQYYAVDYTAGEDEAE